MNPFKFNIPLYKLILQWIDRISTYIGKFGEIQLDPHKWRLIGHDGVTPGGIPFKTDIDDVLRRSIVSKTNNYNDLDNKPVIENYHAWLIRVSTNPAFAYQVVKETEAGGHVYFKSGAGMEIAYSLVEGIHQLTFDTLFQKLTGAIAPKAITDELRIGSVEDLLYAMLQITAQGKTGIKVRGNGAGIDCRTTGSVEAIFAESPWTGGYFRATGANRPAIVAQNSDDVTNTIVEVILMSHSSSWSAGGGAGISFGSAVTHGVLNMFRPASSTPINFEIKLLDSTTEIVRKLLLEGETGNLTVTGSVAVGNDQHTATSANVGAIRYREDANNSYCEMVMKTSPSTYAWVVIKQNTW